MRAGRRSFLISTAAAALPVWPSGAAAQSGEITVGAIYDVSGPLQVFGQTKTNVLKFAVDETNAAGGLLGKKIRLAAYDTQSNNQLYAQFAQQVSVRDKAQVVFAAVTSASREVIRPILRRGNTLYFYNMTYEGGVCDRNIIITGPTPSQSLQIMQPDLIKRFGPVPGVDRDITVVRSGFRLASGDPEPTTPPPVLGTDTEQILKQLGYDQEAIRMLKQNGAV